MNQHQLVIDLAFKLASNIKDEQEMYNLLIQYKFKCIEKGFDVNKNISMYFNDWEIKKLNKIYNQHINAESYNEWISTIFNNKIQIKKMNKFQKFLNKWRKKC